VNRDQISPSRQRLSLSMTVQLAFEGTAPTTSIREVLARNWRQRSKTPAPIGDAYPAIWRIGRCRDSPQRGAQFVVAGGSLSLEIVVDSVSEVPGRGSFGRALLDRRINLRTYPTRMHSVRIFGIALRHVYPLIQRGVVGLRTGRPPTEPPAPAAR
jgi:hypothetical protein